MARPNLRDARLPRVQEPFASAAEAALATSWPPQNPPALSMTPDVAVVTPLNNPGGPEGDTVTANNPS
jgi:hypothetical protein